MSIFGNLDAANIPTNPFYVEAGTYSAQVSKAEYSTNRDGVRQLRIEYIIDDEDSEYLDSRVTQYFNLVAADLTQEAFELLPIEEKRRIRKNLASLKRTLCGNDGNENQPGLGLGYEELNDPNWNPAVLKGLKVNLAVSNYGIDNQGVNVRWVNRTF